MNTLESPRPAHSVNLPRIAPENRSREIDFAAIRLPGMDDHHRLPVTARQLEIWKLYAEGFGTGAIAEKLGLSRKTVESHREHLKERTGARNSADLTRAAVALGIIRVPIVGGAS